MTADPRPILNLGPGGFPRTQDQVELNLLFRRASNPDHDERQRRIATTLLNRYTRSIDSRISRYAFWLTRLLDWCQHHPDQKVWLPGETAGRPAQKTEEGPGDPFSIDFRAAAYFNELEKQRRESRESFAQQGGMWSGLPAAI